MAKIIHPLELAQQALINLNRDGLQPGTVPYIEVHNKVATRPSYRYCHSHSKIEDVRPALRYELLGLLVLTQAELDTSGERWDALRKYLCDDRSRISFESRLHAGIDLVYKELQATLGSIQIACLEILCDGTRYDWHKPGWVYMDSRRNEMALAGDLFDQMVVISERFQHSNYVNEARMLLKLMIGHDGFLPLLMLQDMAEAEAKAKRKD